MNKIDNDLVRQVDDRLCKRYTDRLQEFGYDPRTLGWDTLENQKTRFRTAVDTVDLTNASLLDIGCGLADFYFYLRERGVELSRYTGMDINQDLINACQSKTVDSDTGFIVGNLLLNPPKPESYDVVCLFGLLNFRFNEFENKDFARQMISQAFQVARQTVVVDMLSALHDPGYQSEDFVYYYDPMEMLDFAFSLTPHVQIRHDYRSIPQREFMLILRKSPCA